MNQIDEVLKKLKIAKRGVYDNHFYIIKLNNSDDYANMFSKLEETSVNTEYPTFEVNEQKNTTKINTYFEIEVDGVNYNIFLIADFKNDNYYLKIGVA